MKLLVHSHKVNGTPHEVTCALTSSYLHTYLKLLVLLHEVTGTLTKLMAHSFKVTGSAT